MWDIIKFRITAGDKSGPVWNALKSNLGDVKGALRGIDDDARRLGKTMRNIGIGSTAAVTAPLALIGRESVRLYDQQIRAEQAVATAIQSTGGAAGLAADELFRQASALQALGVVGDEDILQNVTAPLLTFTQVSGEAFTEAQTAILNMSALLGTDLRSTALQVGKALNDPVRGITALQRAGVQLDDQQRDMVKTMVAVGDVAGAQAIILGELETQFGGQMEALAAAPLGQLDQLSNAIGDLKEDLGEEIVPFLVPLVDKVQDAVAWFGQLDPVVAENIVVFGGLAAAAGPVLVVLGLITASASVLITALTGPVGIVAALLAAGGAATAFWPLLGDVEAASYDAAEGTAAVNAALSVFGDHYAPAAARSAIGLANDNYELAKSAREAAAAEVAKTRSLLSSLEAERSSGWRRQERHANQDLKRQLETLEAAERALAQAQQDRVRAARTVTGSMQDMTVVTGTATSGVTDLNVTLGGIPDTAGSIKSAFDEFDTSIGDFTGSTDMARENFKSFARSVVTESMSAKQALEGLLQSFGSRFIDTGLDLAFDAIAPSLSGIFGGLLGSANGNVFRGGQLMPFAKGGVVNGPTLFPMSGPRTGLMGEAGPEAILPLTRIGGTLGVRAETAGPPPSGGPSGPLEVVVRIDGLPQGVSLRQVRTVAREEASVVVVQGLSAYDEDARETHGLKDQTLRDRGRV